GAAGSGAGDMRWAPSPAGDALYRALLELSAEAIARFELEPPLRVDLPVEEQVAHILRHGRVAECNEAFARLYGSAAMEMMGRAVAEFIPADERREALHQFVAAGYRLADVDVSHVLADGPRPWLRRARPPPRLLDHAARRHRPQAHGGRARAMGPDPGSGGLRGHAHAGARPLARPCRRGDRPPGPCRGRGAGLAGRDHLG